MSTGDLKNNNQSLCSAEDPWNPWQTPAIDQGPSVGEYSRRNCDSWHTVPATPARRQHQLPLGDVSSASLWKRKVPGASAMPQTHWWHQTHVARGSRPGAQKLQGDPTCGVRSRSDLRVEKHPHLCKHSSCAALEATSCFLTLIGMFFRLLRNSHGRQHSTAVKSVVPGFAITLFPTSCNLGRDT